MILIGIALLLLAGLLLYISLSQPRVYSGTESVNISESITEGVSGETEKAETKSAPASEVKTDTEKTSAKSVSYPININTATAEELMSIDGLGEVRACAIIEYREYLGKYKSVEQITEIQGIDEEIYNKVAGYLTV